MTDELKALLCPCCGQRATAPHLKENPACMEAAKSFVGVYSAAKRKSVGKTTGRKKRLQACPRCGLMVGTVEARYGHDGCSVVKATTGDSEGKHNGEV